MAGRHRRITALKTFSVNAIAELLERDRATVIRALRETPPDAVEKRQPRWKMATAVAALERHSRVHDGDNSGGIDPPEYARFDKAYQAAKELPTLAKRRAAAVKTIPLLNAMIAALRQRGREFGEDPEVTDMRADRVYQLAMVGYRAPCEWDHDQVWSNLSIDTGADVV
jgi:hypothetical protein